MEKEYLKKMTYEELVQLQQNDEITMIEFIESQPELADAWSKWVDTNPISEQSAQVFMTQHEQNIMDNQRLD